MCIAAVLCFNCCGKLCFSLTLGHPQFLLYLGGPSHPVFLRKGKIVYRMALSSAACRLDEGGTHGKIPGFF